MYDGVRVYQDYMHRYIPTYVCTYTYFVTNALAVTDDRWNVNQDHTKEPLSYRDVAYKKL